MTCHYGISINYQQMIFKVKYILPGLVLFSIINITFPQNKYLFEGNTVQLKLKTNSMTKNSSESFYHKVSPVVEVIGLNLGVGAIDAYLLKEDWAKISFKTVWCNLKKLPVLDRDKFVVNQFSHPLHGSMYFNIGRANGYTFWQSALFAFGGSLMWEYFMENEPASVNDLVSTTLGGIMLGEMTHRTSNKFIDETRHGIQNILGEIFGSAINLPRLYARLKNKDFSYYGSVRSDTNDYSLRINSGVSFLNVDKLGFNKSGLHYYLQLFYTYGKFKYSGYVKPYEFFRFRAGVNTGRAKYAYIYSYALIAGYNKSCYKSGFGKSFFIGLFQDYDFINNKSAYLIGAQSIGPGFIYDQDFESGVVSKIFISPHLNWIPLGAINSVHPIKGQQYNFGMGAKIMLDAHIVFKKILHLYFDYRFYYMKIYSDYSDRKFAQLINPRVILEMPFDGQFISRLGLGYDFLYYWGEQKYENTRGGESMLKSTGTEDRFFLTYRF